MPDSCVSSLLYSTLQAATLITNIASKYTVNSCYVKFTQVENKSWQEQAISYDNFSSVIKLSCLFRKMFSLI